ALQPVALAGEVAFAFRERAHEVTSCWLGPTALYSPQRARTKPAGSTPVDAEARPDAASQIAFPALEHSPQVRPLAAHEGGQLDQQRRHAKAPRVEAEAEGVLDRRGAVAGADAVIGQPPHRIHRVEQTSPERLITPRPPAPQHSPLDPGRHWMVDIIVIA